MGDIFISYAREDHRAAERLAEALKSSGWSVWWDPDIPPGEIWDELIEHELAAVNCVVVLWSATSIHKHWVKNEASEAMARGILVPVLIEDVKQPLAFRQIQAASLVDWRGERDHGGFQQLLCTVCRLAGTRPQQPTCTAPPSPRQSSPSKLDKRKLRPDALRPTGALPGTPPVRQAGASRVPLVDEMKFRLRRPRWGDIRVRFAAGLSASLLAGAVIGYAGHDGLNRMFGEPSAPTAMQTGAVRSACEAAYEADERASVAHKALAE
jgi:TIR domain